jgi:hypothetical protein
MSRLAFNARVTIMRTAKTSQPAMRRTRMATNARSMTEPLESRTLLSTTGMTNVGRLKLPTGVTAQYSAAIDPTTDFGYFGTASGANPGIVSKVNLSGATPQVVVDGLPNSIPIGITNFNSILIDTTSADSTKHYLYVGSGRGRIMKISPGDATHDPQMMATLTPTEVSGGITCGAIDTTSSDPTQRYAYFGINASTGPVVLRVRLSDFTEQGVESLNMRNLRTCAIDTIHHYLYFTTFGNSGAPQICKVNLATFTPGGTSTATYDMSSTTPGDGIGVAGYGYPGTDVGLAIDPVHQFAYLGTTGGVTDPNRSMIIRINISGGDSFPAHPIATLNFGENERFLSTCVFDSNNGNVYCGTDLTYPGHIYMIHVGDGTGTMSEVGRLDANLGTATTYPPDGQPLPGNDADTYGEIFFRSSIIDTAHNAIYIGTDSRPGQVIKIGINGAPPQISALVSRKINGNVSTDLPLTVSPATIDPRINGPTQIVFTFSEAIQAADGTLDASEFSIANASFASASIAGNQLTLNLTNVVNASDVTIAFQGITDASGNAMFGPTSVTVGALAGDVNQDGIVNALDFNTLASNFGSAAATYSTGDLTGDGHVDTADFDVLAAGFGSALGAPPSNAASSSPGLLSVSQAATARLFSGASPITDSLASSILEPTNNND